MKQLQEEIKKFIENPTAKCFNGSVYRTVTPALIKGEWTTLTEGEVRMCQLLCKRAYDISDEEGDKFVKDYQVYSIDGKGGIYLMEYQKNGYFFNEFLSGFYDVNTRITIEVL